MEQKYHSFAPCGCFDAFENQETDFLKEYQHWFLTLNKKQDFLGRSLLIFKKHKTDERELTDQEVLEKHHIYQNWRDAVDKAFAPDKINLALSGNEEALHRGHVHWHFIPRYRRPISFAGTSFFHDTAETVSRPIASFETNIVIRREVREMIRNELVKSL